jgi:hypothetical protein
VENRPATAPAAGAGAAPAPAAAVRPRDRSAPPPRSAAPTAGGRRRGRALWPAALLVVLVLAGLIAFWALDPAGDDGGFSAQDPFPAASEPAQQETQPPTQESIDPTPTPTPETTAAETGDEAPVDAGSVRARDVERAVRDFFQQLPDDTEDAYALTSPAFQDAHDYTSFESFWEQFDDVRLRDVQAQDGSASATVQIEYRWDDDSRQRELHTMTFAIADDGELLLDSDDYQGQAG